MARIIVVPAHTFIPARTIPVRDQTPAYAFGNINIPAPCPKTVEIPAQIERDPYWDYAAWYGGDWTTTISRASIDHKFWGARDLNDWIESNIQGYVLVQSINIGDWRIGFRDAAEMRKFETWFHKVQKRGLVTVHVTEGEFNEIKDWIKENLKGETRVDRSYSNKPGKISANVSCYDLAEAAAFKLRWYQGEDA